MQGQSLLLRADQVAELLGVSRSKVFSMMASGEMPGVVRIGRSVRVSRSALESWVKARAGEEVDGPDDRRPAARDQISDHRA